MQEIHFPVFLRRSLINVIGNIEHTSANTDLVLNYMLFKLYIYIYI